MNKLTQCSVDEAISSIKAVINTNTSVIIFQARFMF